MSGADRQLLSARAGDEEAQELLSEEPAEKAAVEVARKPAVRQDVLRRLLALASEDRLLVVLGAFAVLISSAFDSLVPSYSARALALILADADGHSKGTGEGSVTQPATFAGARDGLIVCAVFAALFTGCRVWCTALLEVRVVARLQERLFRSIMVQDTAFFDSTSSGELASRLTSDVTVLSTSLTTNANYIGQQGVNLLASVAVMFSVDAGLTSWFVLVSFVYFYATKQVGKITGRMQKDIQDATSKANGASTQAISLLRTVRSLGGEGLEVERYTEQVQELWLKQERIKLVWSVYAPITSLITNLLLLFVLLAGHSRVKTPAQGASFAVFVFYCSRLQSALSAISSNWASLLGGLGAGVTIFELIDRQPRTDTVGGLVPPGVPAGHLEFRNISFGFPDRPLTLRGVSLTVPVGGRIAVVGASGGGKSTLLSLALRLYEPAGGCVMLDSRDVATLRPSFLRSVIASVTQEPPLFAMTVKENILYAAPPGSDARIETAVTVAHLDGVVAQFPNGLDTLVGERGMRLSGGQKQRVALARAVVRNPSLLVLDEATSALDADSERRVAAALEAHMASKGMLLVAHRLSTVRTADLIVVLRAGLVAEQGTYDELLAQNGVFRALVAQQLQSVEAEAATPTE